MVKLGRGLTRRIGRFGGLMRMIGRIYLLVLPDLLSLMTVSASSLLGVLPLLAGLKELSLSESSKSTLRVDMFSSA